MVELAIVLPILLTFLLGMVDLGRAFNYKTDETHLATTAARFAAVQRNPSTTGTLQNYIRNQADSAELKNGAHVCIGYNDDNGIPGLGVGDTVHATVTFDFHWLPFLSDQVIHAATATIRGSGVMRLEQKQGAVAAGCDP